MFTSWTFFTFNDLIVFVYLLICIMLEGIDTYLLHSHNSGYQRSTTTYYMYLAPPSTQRYVQTISVDLRTKYTHLWSAPRCYSPGGFTLLTRLKCIDRCPNCRHHVTYAREGLARADDCAVYCRARSQA